MILTGAIGDFGEAVSVYPDGTINPQHNAELNLALTRGSFRKRIAARMVSLWAASMPSTSNAGSASA